MASSAVGTIIGYLGGDPETKGDGDKEFASFSMATENVGRDKEASWWRVIVFGGLIEVVEKYLEKGSQVAVTGRLQIRKWERDDKSEGTSVEIIASTLTLLGSPNGRRDNDSRDRNSRDRDRNSNDRGSRGKDRSRNRQRDRKRDDEGSADFPYGENESRK